MIFMGIDPGISGALAFYRPHDHSLRVYDMPTFEKMNGKNEIDGVELAKLVKGFNRHGPITRAVMEEVGGMVYMNKYGERRGQGSAQSFAFGKSAGIMLGILDALEIPVSKVRPAVWKSIMKLSRSKDLSRHRAAAMFPRESDEFSRKKDDGKAEAALLAFFAYDRFSQGRLGP